MTESDFYTPAHSCCRNNDEGTRSKIDPKYLGIPNIQ